MPDRRRALGVVTHTVDPGGVQRVAIRESQALAADGYDVTLHSMIKPRTPWTALLDGVDLRYLVDVGDGAVGEAASRLASGFARLPDDADLHLCHNLPGAQLCYRAKRDYGTPYVAYVHDATAYPIAGSPYSLFFGRYSPDVDADALGPLGRLGLAMERRWLDGASAVVANAERTAREIEARHGLTAEVLYPTMTGPVGCDSTGPPTNRDFLVVQRLEPHPTYDVVEGLLDRIPSLGVTIAGSAGAAPLEAAVRRRFGRFADRVTVVTDPTDERLARFYASSFAFLHPGIENFNMSALEAARFGRPIVVAAESGIAALFDGYPLFAPADDLDAFEGVVRGLLEDPERAARLGGEAAAVAETYDDRFHVERLRGILDRCWEGAE